MCVFLCRIRIFTTALTITLTHTCENLCGCIHVNICINLVDLYLHMFLRLPGSLFECGEEKAHSNKPEAVNPDRKKAKTGLS